MSSAAVHAVITAVTVQLLQLLNSQWFQVRCKVICSTCLWSCDRSVSTITFMYPSFFAVGLSHPYMQQ